MESYCDVVLRGEEAASTAFPSARCPALTCDDIFSSSTVVASLNEVAVTDTSLSTFSSGRVVSVSVDRGSEGADCCWETESCAEIDVGRRATTLRGGEPGGGGGGGGEGEGDGEGL